MGKDDSKFQKKLVKIRNRLATAARDAYVEPYRRRGNYNNIAAEYTLPEVEVAPRDNVTSELKSILNNNALRSDFYLHSAKVKNISERDYAKRFLNLYNYAGRPGISDRSISNETTWLIDKDNINRANYMNNTMYLPHYSFKELVAELPHAIHNNYKGLGENKSNFLKEASDYLIEGGGDKEYTFNGVKKNNYANPFHYENFTHSVLEPAIKAYLNTAKDISFDKLVNGFNILNKEKNKEEIDRRKKRIEGATRYLASPHFNTYGIAMRNGGTIHINPANRGKFNATKRRTGKTTEELTHSKNPKTRKRAIFAQNAAKWRKRG